MGHIPLLMKAGTRFRPFCFVRARTVSQMKGKYWLLLGLILVIAAALRLTGIDWDAYNHYNPDERYITWVATTIEAPADWSTALEPTASSFNPFYWPEDAESEGIEVLQGEPRSFAYGHLPLYLGGCCYQIC